MKRASRTLYLLKRAETASRAGVDAVLQDLSVTPGQYTTMSLLRTQREVSSAELARQVGVTPQSMSEMIAVLERKELIARSENPANKRVLRIGLTPAGAALMQACDLRVDRLEKELLSGLSVDQLEVFRTVLVGIAHHSLPSGAARDQARGDAKLPGEGADEGGV